MPAPAPVQILADSGGPVIDGWLIQQRKVLRSTQRVAADFPAWTAVMAESQTDGRGQYERSFTSDRGGFYLTAVLPFDGDAARWRGFALVVGMAVHDRLHAMQFKDIRLRWPNDLMIGARKVGGILVEQGSRNTLLVGIGLNVSNTPWDHDPSLIGVAGRLVDATAGDGLTPGDFLQPMLAAVRQAYDQFAASRLFDLTARINRCWHGSRAVELMVTDGVTADLSAGNFLGIDQQGAVLLETARGERVAIAEHRIRRLHEV